MWQTSEESELKSGTFATIDRGDPAPANAPCSSKSDSELLGLVEDAELCAQLQSDPELIELAELTQLAEQVRTALAPARRNIELGVRERVQRICSAVLKRSGALPPEAALMDEAAQDRLIERRLAEYRRESKRGFVKKLFSARVRGRRDGP